MFSVDHGRFRTGDDGNLGATMTPPLLDVMDSSVFAQGHPHSLYDATRRETPVMRHPGTSAVPPFWVLTRYADIQALSLDADRFTSGLGVRIPCEPATPTDSAVERAQSRFMQAMDRPEHDAYREIVAQAFSPTQLRTLEPRIALGVRTLMDRLKVRGGDVDFISDVAAAIPIRTLCLLLGVPDGDEQRVFDLTNPLFAVGAAASSPTPDAANDRFNAVLDYAGWLIDLRRNDPRDDIASIVAWAEIDGAPLGRAEQISFVFNLMAAGNETTRSALAGAVWALAQYPDQRALLLADRGRIPLAVSELLRWHSPVLHMARTAKADVDLSGVSIKAGERVMLLYGAGNHDPSVFEDPHRLDVARSNAGRHLAFGAGVHHCLGSRLAGMQMRLLLNDFLVRFPHYELRSEPERVASNAVQTMRRMPVSLGA